MNFDSDSIMRIVLFCAIVYSESDENDFVQIFFKEITLTALTVSGILTVIAMAGVLEDTLRMPRLGL